VTTFFSWGHFCQP